MATGEMSREEFDAFPHQWVIVSATYVMECGLKVQQPKLLSVSVVS